MDQTDTQMQDVLLRTATEAACSSLLKHTCSYKDVTNSIVTEKWLTQFSVDGMLIFLQRLF
jgi:hypothetical protein